MELTLDSTFELNNGIKIPILGLGTAGLMLKRAYQSVIWALDMGYRLIDTATMYGNEKKIGKALKESGVPREEIFITTKVWNTDQGYNNTLSAFEKSLNNLGLSYVDLYLVHWPVTRLRNETWKALEKLLEDGKTRAIGVSNYTIRHLTELMENSSNIPTVNQVEFTPFLFQRDLLEFCQKNNIIVEAYSPLTRGQKFNNPILKAIGEQYGKTSAQILIRWGLQHGIIEIPRSKSKEHIHDNADVFDFNLNGEDMGQLDNLNENFRTTEDPEKIK